MQKQKNIRLLLTIIFIAAHLFPCFAQPDSPGVRFNYGILLVNESGQIEEVCTQNRVQMKNGQRYQIYLEPVEDAYIYLYQLTSDNQFLLLFPHDFQVFSDEDYYNTYLLPGKNNHFIIVPPGGKERLFLVVSHTRLKELETLTNTHMMIKGDNSFRQIRNSTFVQAILDEIESLIAANMDLIPAEKPIPLAGTFKADENFPVIQVLSPGIYCSKIDLIH